MRKTALTLAFLAAGTFACQSQQATEGADSAKPAAETGEATASAKPATEKAGKVIADCADDQAADHGEGGAGTSSRLTHDTAKTTTGENGETITHVGKDFADAPEVSLADLIAKSDDYVGKVVRVKGNVNAMCNHKRGWFSVISEDGTGWVRIITTPTFLVPAGTVGKKAVAEGKVDVIDVKGAFVKHIAGEHKLDTEEVDPEATVKQVIIRAEGADFI